MCHALKTYLWCQIEPQIAVAYKSILNQKRDLVRQAELDLV